MEVHWKPDRSSGEGGYPVTTAKVRSMASTTGIVSQSLLRFKRGETSLRLDKADVLAGCLGLELVKRKAKHEQNL